jgi:hypothetical protein
VGTVRDDVAVYVSHHQMIVSAGGELGGLGLHTVGDDLLNLTGESTLTVFTGVHTGDVEVRVHPGPVAPTDDADGWDVDGEATLWCPHGWVSVFGLMGDGPDALRQVPLPGPGLVGVQVRGRNQRWDDEDADEDEPPASPEEYAVHVWPVAVETGLRSVAPSPAKAAEWAMLRLVTRANIDLRRRGQDQSLPTGPVQRVEVRRSHHSPADPLMGAVRDGDDLLLPAGDLQVRLSRQPAAGGSRRFRWTWEQALDPVSLDPMTRLPDDEASEVELRLDPATGESTVHHRHVQGQDAVLLGLVWEHLLADPEVPYPWQAAFATLAATSRRESEDGRRRRTADEARMWGGRVPSERVRALPANALSLARLDRSLLDALDRTTPDEQRAVARWAARRAAGTAGMSGVDWIDAALAAVDAGAPLPDPFDDEGGTWERLFTDPRVPRTTITVPNGPANCSQQAVALPAIRAATHADPLAAAVEAVYAAAVAHGADHPRFVADLRAAFPDLR